MSQLTLLMKRMTANEEQLAIVRDNLFEERRLSSKYEKKIMALEK